MFYYYFCLKIFSFCFMWFIKWRKPLIKLLHKIKSIEKFFVFLPIFNVKAFKINPPLKVTTVCIKSDLPFVHLSSFTFWKKSCVYTLNPAQFLVPKTYSVSCCKESTFFWSCSPFPHHWKMMSTYVQESSICICPKKKIARLRFPCPEMIVILQSVDDC